jgi:hypothetical protein
MEMVTDTTPEAHRASRWYRFKNKNKVYETTKSILSSFPPGVVPEVEIQLSHPPIIWQLEEPLELDNPEKKYNIKNATGNIIEQKTFDEIRDDIVGKNITVVDNEAMPIRFVTEDATGVLKTKSKTKSKTKEKTKSKIKSKIKSKKI